MYVHKSVMLKEVLEYLQCSDEKIYIDGTVGEGGHAERILEQSSPTGRLIGIDLDQEILERASQRLKRFGSRAHLVQGNFKNIREILQLLNLSKVDGFLVDLGISAFHFQSQTRGFSFQIDAPLDMRLDQNNPMTAARIVNESDQRELASIIWKYGEERWSRRISQSICYYRQKTPIVTTGQLAEIVVLAIPPRFRSRKIHPATKTFQALRITVNQELAGLEEALIEAAKTLNKGGRMCVISFHSLEDRIVKMTFRKLSQGQEGDNIYTFSTHVKGRDRSKEGKGFTKEEDSLKAPLIKILTKKPVTPSESEMGENIRARSAKLRVAERC